MDSEWVLVQEARDYHGGFWPAELTSGVMFWKGHKITRDEFSRGHLTSPAAPPPPAEQASGEQPVSNPDELTRESAREYLRREYRKRGMGEGFATDTGTPTAIALDAIAAALSQRPEESK